MKSHFDMFEEITCDPKAASVLVHRKMVEDKDRGNLIQTSPSLKIAVLAAPATNSNKTIPLASPLNSPHSR